MSCNDDEGDSIGRDTSKHTTASAPYATGMIGISSFDQVSDGDNDVVCGGDGVNACSHLAVVGAVVSELL